MHRWTTMLFLCIGLVGCAASTRAVVSQPGATEEIEPSEAGGAEEKSIRVEVDMPSTDWAQVPSDELNGGQIIAFRNAKLRAKVDIFVQYKEGTDAHKIAQYLALVIATNGAEPLAIEGDPDGNFAFLEFRGGNKEIGPVYGIMEIFRSDFEPNLYVLVIGIWSEASHNASMLDQFQEIVESVHLTFQ